MRNKERSKIKILYIDPLSQDGHITFNNIYIKLLKEISGELHFAFKRGYEKKIDNIENDFVYSIPTKYYSKRKNKILKRIDLINILFYIKKKCNIYEYDYVFLSSYEEISLFFSFIQKQLILVNHNNLKAISNKIKYFFFKKTANKNINIVFEEYMKDYLEKKGIKNIYCIKHGLPIRFCQDVLKNNLLKSDFSFMNKYKYIIFAPSSTSGDENILRELNSNIEFHTFLKVNNILLIIKDKHLNSKNPNICIVKNHLTDSEYQYLFLKCNLILIPYPQSFSHRVSAILFESIANDKLCLISRIPALTINKQYFRYNPFFDSINELMHRINQNLSLSEEIKADPYKDLEKLKPNFEEFFELINKD